MMMMRSGFTIILSLLLSSPFASAFVTTPTHYHHVTSSSSSSSSTTSSTTTALPMVAIDTSDIKNGLTVELDDGEPYKVVSFSIMKQARGAAKTTIKFKNLMRGTTIENTYRSGEKFQTAMIEKTDAQYTYNEGINYYFMDSATFDEIIVPETVVGDKHKWISEGATVKLVMFNDNVIEVLPPSPAVFEIVETEPNMKGNTAQGYTKPAVLDCGATVTVPGFLETGEKIKVDTEKGEYMERVK